jgi:hypothetical protein
MRALAPLDPKFMPHISSGEYLRKSRDELVSFFGFDLSGELGDQSKLQAFAEKYKGNGSPGRIAIGHNNFNNSSDIEIIASMLEPTRQNSLSVLWLNSCNISDNGFLTLIDAIRKKYRFMKPYEFDPLDFRGLDVSRNHISDHSVKQFAYFLNEDPNFTELKINHNQITDDGLTALADALRNNTHLKSLDLRGHNFTEDGISYLLDALSDNYSITELDIDDLSDQHEAKLKLILDRNHRIDFLDFELNELKRTCSMDFYFDELFINKTLDNFSQKITKVKGALATLSDLDSITAGIVETRIQRKIGKFATKMIEKFRALESQDSPPERVSTLRQELEELRQSIAESCEQKFYGFMGEGIIDAAIEACLAGPQGCETAAEMRGNALDIAYMEQASAQRFQEDSQADAPALPREVIFLNVLSELLNDDHSFLDCLLLNADTTFDVFLYGIYNQSAPLPSLPHDANERLMRLQTVLIRGMRAHISKSIQSDSTPGLFQPSDRCQAILLDLARILDKIQLPDSSPAIIFADIDCWLKQHVKTLNGRLSEKGREIAAEMPTPTTFDEILSWGKITDAVLSIAATTTPEISLTIG